MLFVCLPVRPSARLSVWLADWAWLLAESETQTEIETETDRQPGRQDRDRQDICTIYNPSVSAPGASMYVNVYAPVLGFADITNRVALQIRTTQVKPQ